MGPFLNSKDTELDVSNYVYEMRLIVINQTLIFPTFSEHVESNHLKVHAHSKTIIRGM